MQRLHTPRLLVVIPVFSVTQILAWGSSYYLLAVLAYAIEVLEVSHVIVCGHYGCGGIRAALDGHHQGVIDHWLQPIRDVTERNSAELAQVAGQDSKLHLLCEMSTRNQVERLERTPIVQSAWARGKRVRIHGWAYGLEDGLISDLKCSVPDLVPPPAKAI